MSYYTNVICDKCGFKLGWCQCKPNKCEFCTEPCGNSWCVTNDNNVECSDIEQCSPIIEQTIEQKDKVFEQKPKKLSFIKSFAAFLADFKASRNR